MASWIDFSKTLWQYWVLLKNLRKIYNKWISGIMIIVSMRKVYIFRANQLTELEQRIDPLKLLFLIYIIGIFFSMIIEFVLAFGKTIILSSIL